MARFRLQENVPDIYVEQSRDFQLFCNLFDVVNGGVKFDIDSIRDVSDTELCSDRLLEFLKVKLGFLSNKHISTTALRIILKGFPYLIKNKGSRLGIQQAIILFLKTQGIEGAVTVIPQNRVTNDYDDLIDTYKVDVSIKSQLLDITILEELLKYVLPAGYDIEYQFYDTLKRDTNIYVSDKITIIFGRDDNRGLRVAPVGVETSDSELSNTIRMSAVGTTVMADGTEVEENAK